MSISALETNVTLLCRVKDKSDQDAWAEFVELYTPMIYGYLRRSGVQDADATDLAQEVMLSVNQHIDRFQYDPKIGRFRGWLQTITRNKLLSFIKSRKKKASGAGDSGVLQMLQNIEDDSESDEDRWEEQYRKRTFEWAMSKVRPAVQPNTWRAFWAAAIENKPTPQIATELDMTPGAIYLAKARVIARIRDQIQTIGDE